MTYAVRSHPSAYSRAPLARFGPALAASALVHWALLSGLLPDSVWWGVVSYPAAAPITVRLAPVAVLVPEAPPSPDREARRVPLQAKQPAASAERVPDGHTPSGAARPGAETPALAPAPDPNYYPARDLDNYPRPLAPLRLDRPAGERAGEARFELLIDERGVVQDVIVVGPAVPGRAEEKLLATLAATHFVPARKDGRAVKSRVILRVGFASEDGER
ncbi:MAG: hypothetical protein ACREVR_13095 [Burkholderiales bacterium]